MTTDTSPETPPFTLEHTSLSDEEARALLSGREFKLGERVMNAKAQIVAEFVKSIRVPGYFPSLPELRQQLRTMVDLMDEPAPAIARKEDATIPGPGGDLPVRIYSAQARSASLQPVLMYLHGGGWVQGDLETHDGLCARLAAWSPAMVVAIDYRLAPENPFPAAVEDSLAAYRWLRANAQTFGGDPERIAVAGDSAGGNLSAVLSQQVFAEDMPVPQFQVLIYPATDLAMNMRSHIELKQDAVIPEDRLNWYLEQYRGNGDLVHDERASPARANDLRGQPPTLILCGGFDPLRDDAKAYGDRLIEAGVDIVFHEYPGQIHAFMMLTKAIPEGIEAIHEVADYVRRKFSA